MLSTISQMRCYRFYYFVVEQPPAWTIATLRAPVSTGDRFRDRIPLLCYK
jgi:hypothetical protein